MGGETDLQSSAERDAFLWVDVHLLYHCVAVAAFLGRKGGCFCLFVCLFGWVGYGWIEEKQVV